MSENKFRFKKDGIEIELSGDQDYLNKQIENWKPFIEKLSFEPPKDINNSLINDSLNTENFIHIKSDFLNTFETVQLDDQGQQTHESIDKDIKIKNQLEQQLNNHQIKVIKNITLEDFFALKNPQTDTDKVIVAAYYFERYNKYDSFSELDLYSALNIPGIENHLLMNMANGYLCLSENKNNLNHYTLTYSGEIYVREEIGYIQ